MILYAYMICDIDDNDSDDRNNSNDNHADMYVYIYIYMYVYWERMPLWSLEPHAQTTVLDAGQESH